MTNSEALGFAREWIENWNRKDVEAVLSHFAAEAAYTSPKALPIAGRSTLTSRGELASYWHAGVKSIRAINFTLDHVVNDPSAQRVTIVYIADIDGKRLRAAEFFEFNESSQVVRGEAMYGAALP